MQLSDLILLTDTTGILTGEEKISVLGVNVAIQRETIRQRQIEFLQATMNPTDMKLMGITGRGKVLRAVSQTIGLNGEDVVPSDDQLERMHKQQEQQQAHGPVMEMVEKGVNEGVQQGIKKITTELTAGELAMQLGMPEGGATHLGTMPQQGQSPEGQEGEVGSQGTGGGSAQHDAAVGQGSRPPNRAGGGMAPQTHLFGQQAQGPNTKLSPGIG
jgi:hypothetical protein